MREVKAGYITEAVKQMCMEANYYLPRDVLEAIKEKKEYEISEIGRGILGIILENAEIARKEGVAICQDTGMPVFFVEIGQEVVVTGGSITGAINKGVREGYLQGYLRRSMVEDPLNRINTGDNTPAIIHYDIVEGDRVRIVFAPKGAGSENMSAVKMLSPADGEEGVKKFVVETVDKAGANPCPPVVVGVGIGGTMEKAAQLAKKAITRPLNVRNSNPYYERMEIELLEQINKLGIGPQGLGGSTTALAVNIETYPTHIACLPVAVNINCHATRHIERII